ncbi:MAG: hypothetical protein JWP13_87, partial [Candidatus Saccharibacteria bacterium]|nr:hypothetical protein [Candidatus Saccharibacteria bacterium]
MQISLRTKLHMKLRKFYYLWAYRLGFIGADGQRLWHRGHTKRAMAALFFVVFAGAMVINVLTQVPVKAQTKTFGASDIRNGIVDYNQVQVGANGSSFSLQNGDIGKWSGSDGMAAPTSLSFGDTSLVYGPNNSLYSMDALSGCRFKKFVEEFQQWTDMRTPPEGCGTGARLVTDKVAYLYYFPGGNSNGFYRYDIATDTWSTLANSPSDVGRGASAAYVSSGTGAIYLMRGNSSAAFAQYDVSTNLWSIKAPFPTTGSVSEGLSITWDGSNTIYAISNNGGEFKKYTLATNTWTALTSADGSGCPRHSLVWASGSVFDVDVMACSDVTALQRYDPVVNSWTRMTSPPTSQQHDYTYNAAFDGVDTIYTRSGAYEHSVIYKYSVSQQRWLGNQLARGNTSGNWTTWKPMYDGGNYAYYIGGSGWGNMDKIFRYDLSNQQFSQVGGQFTGNNGIAGTYSNNALYTVDWFGGNSFLKYDLGTSDWIQLADMPFTSDWGSDIVDGGDGYLYATFGARSNFYRFSEATGWQSLASMPTQVGEGGGITRVGTTIYVQAGRSSPFLMQYNMTTGVWSWSTDTPLGGVSHGGFITSDNSRYIYSGLGTRTDPHNKYFYRYDTTTKVWKRMANLPRATNVGAFAFYDSVRSKVWVKPGSYMSYIWAWDAGTTTYVDNSSWYSAVTDLKQVQAWNGLQVSSTGSGSVTVYTRTSAKGKLWSDWQQVTGTNINSQPRRFMQIKVTLSGGGNTTPTVTGLVLNYDQEAAASSLPSQLTALSKKGGQPLTSGDKYPHQHPYFSWTGADDGNNGSGVAGYYVYYGGDSNADPQTSGSYQTGTEYIVSTAMTAGEVYYLRIKVKDNLGNVSDAATYFSYLYFYISPPGSVLTSGKSQISSGTNTGLSVDDDGKMSLIQQQLGTWSVGPMQMMPDNTGGPDMAVVGDFLYVLRGNTSGDFWRYDTTSGTWLTLARQPDNVSTGSALAWDGGNFLYSMTGRNTNTFYRYNIQNNAWETLPVLPAFAQPGSDMRYIGNNTLAFVFSGSAEFYFYDIANGSFTSKTSTPYIINSNAGSGMWYDGADTIYVYFGGYDRWQQNRKSLAKYSIAQDTWRLLSQPSIEAWYGENNLVSDGQGHLYMFNNDYYLSQSADNIAMVYTIATDTWDRVPNAIGQDIRGSAASDGKRYIYVIPNSGNSRRIIRYDTWDKRFTPDDTAIPSWQRMPWDDQSSWAWAAGNASSAAYDGSEYVYALGANEGTWSRFLKRSLKTGKSEYLPPPPYVGIGGGLTFSGGTLYYMPGTNRPNLYKFDMNSLTWERLADMPVARDRAGSGSLVALKDGSLLTFRGTNNQVYKFTPNSGAGTWAAMANAPGTIRQGGATYDGDNTVYVAGGNGLRTFYSYNVSANTWNTLTQIPVVANLSVPMMFKDGKVYLAPSNNTTSLYVYTPSSNTWQAGPNAPEYFRYGASFLPIDNNYALVIAGQDSPDMWRFDFPGQNRAYQGLATHISQPMSVDGLFDYAGIQAEIQAPENTKAELWTRTSADGTTWDEWMMADNIKQFNGSVSALVKSRPQKFTQVKVILYSYDNIYTPTVSNYALDYYFDVTPPTNPSVLTAYSDASKSTTMPSNVWQNKDKPVFDWPDPGQAGGPTDGPLGSNLKGYWVYVGTDPTAIPLTSGTFVTATEYSPNLTVAGTYYVRLQAVDMTGNVDPAVFAPYIYKFDNTPPTNPALITVTPGGFTGRNNYSFIWPNGFDNDSGIDEYCYHTGALSGPFAVEICQKELEVKDVAAAYQAGTNVFYLRTKDIAGNYSPSYAATSYYYSTDPPSPVTDLRAVPPSSAQNLFAFVWDLPSLFSGDPSQLTYCYSINVLPTPTNTTCAPDRFISAFKAASQQGTNILYMVAKDEAGNVNWNSYASTNFIANTVSPGIPLNLAVNDTSDSVTGRYSLTMTWDEPTFKGNGITQYVIERSNDDHTYTQIGRVSNTAYVDLTVEANTKYYYRVRASDNVDNIGGPSAIVAQTPKGNFATPPKIVSEPKATASFDQATVNWVTDRSSTSFVYYGTSPTSLTQSKGTLDLTTEHAMTLTGLRPSTVYYYKVQSFDNNRSYDIESANSPLYTFRTTEVARIFNVQSSEPTLSSAVVSWQTSVPTTARIEYGLTRDYGFSQQDETGMTSSHLFRLEDLTSGTTYHYRIVSTTDYGSQVLSDDYTFTTISRPKVTNVSFQPINTANTLSVKVSWTTNVPTSSDVAYSALGSKQAESSADLVREHEIIINDLASSTEYDFLIQGRDQYGNQAVSDRQKWRSGVDTKSPTISELSISATTTQGGGNAKAQLIISWRTDEPSTTQLLYGPGSSSKLTKKTTLDP